MEDEKPRRVQLSKEQKRILAERSTEAAFADEERRRRDMAEKTEKLRALRLAKEAEQQQKSGS